MDLNSDCKLIKNDAEGKGSHLEGAQLGALEGSGDWRDVGRQTVG